MAANVCTTSSGRLFVTDRISKQRHLVDIRYDLCVFPRKLQPGRRERTDYTLYAENGSTIPTKGSTARNFNLGKRREFTWRFVVAYMQVPTIGVDRLPDGVTSLTTTGLIEPPSVPSAKVFAGGPPPTA